MPSTSPPPATGIGAASARPILGETHAFGPDSDYWAEWINHRLGSGVCNDVLAAGDDVLMHVDFSPPPGYASTVFPIEVSGVPASAGRGEPFTVSVVEHRLDAAFAGVATPAAGVTVAGGGTRAVTGADGKATLALPAAGTFTLQASRAGGTRSVPASVCVHDGADGTCGTSVPEAVVVAEKPTPPTGSIAGVTGGQRFTAARAPRELRGTIRAGSVARALGRICASCAGRARAASSTARSASASRRTRLCERGWYYYKVAERPDWSYLLPGRLGAGRYTLEVVGTDRAGLTTTARTAFTVQAAPRAPTGRAAR